MSRGVYNDDREWGILWHALLFLYESVLNQFISWRKSLILDGFDLIAIKIEETLQACTQDVVDLQDNIKFENSFCRKKYPKSKLYYNYLK